MRRTMLALAMSGLVLSGVGCMQGGSYVEKHPDWGIVAVKSQADQEKAASMIRKHVGDDYVIVEQYDPRSKPFDPQAGVSGLSTSTSNKDMGWYVKYAKKVNLPAAATTSMVGMGNNTRTAVAGGLPQPDMNGIRQAGFHQPIHPQAGMNQQPQPIAGTGMPGSYPAAGSNPMPTNLRPNMGQPIGMSGQVNPANANQGPGQPVNQAMPGQPVGQFNPYAK